MGLFIFRINLKLWGIYTLYISIYFCIQFVNIENSATVFKRDMFFTIFVLNFIFFCSHFIYFLLLLICSSLCSFCHTPWFWAQYTFALASVILENEVKVAQSCPPLCNSVDCSHQAPLSMDFSRQEKTHWSGFPFPSPGDLPDPGIEPRSPAFRIVGRQRATVWATSEVRLEAAPTVITPVLQSQAGLRSSSLWLV